ncbi:MAG: NrfD/PsrC family molybdoenzyme membrane anchor subunit [Caldilineaceae bacterium]
MATIVEKMEKPAQPAKADKQPWFPEFASGGELMKTAAPTGVAEEGYYGIPMLKRPLWHWHIAFYFFLEGISAGAFLIATLARLFAPRRYRNLERVASYLSLLTLLPCPPLLIADLGRPARFQHMLRVFKLSSPMNTGAWALTGFSLPVGLLAIKQFCAEFMRRSSWQSKLGRLLPARVTGVFGLPFALTMISYPGVLLSTTSTPIWARTRFLGALLASSSIGNAVAALSLGLAWQGHTREVKALEKIEMAANLCEVATLTAYLTSAGKTAEPLTKGRYAKHLWLGAVGTGLVLPLLLCLMNRGRKEQRTLLVVRSLLTLVGGLALKWAIVYAGRTSAESPEAARYATTPTEQAPGWGRR